MITKKLLLDKQSKTEGIFCLCKVSPSVAMHYFPQWCHLGISEGKMNLQFCAQISNLWFYGLRVFPCTGNWARIQNGSCRCVKQLFLNIFAVAAHKAEIQICRSFFHCNCITSVGALFWSIMHMHLLLPALKHCLLISSAYLPRTLGSSLGCGIAATCYLVNPENSLDVSRYMTCFSFVWSCASCLFMRG